MITLDTIPSQWMTLLRCLHDNGFPEAVLGGGCLRDLENQRNVKDLDFFVQDRGDGTEDMITAALLPQEKGEELKRGAPTVLFTQEMSQYFGAVDVVRAFDYGCDITEGLREYAQVITLKNAVHPKVVADRMDFGICRIATDGSFIYRSDIYERDVADKTFTLSRCENQNQFDRSIDRFLRLSKKYPGWRLVVPPAYNEYHKEWCQKEGANAKVAV